MSNAMRHPRWKSSLDSVGQDLRLAMRMMRRSPGVAAIIVLTLALGIGANAAIFGVVNSLLLRPLPVADPHRLVTISSQFAVDRGYPAGLGWSLAMWERLQPHVSLVDDAFAWMATRFDLAQGGEKQPADGVFASGGYFTTLGVPALLGRTLTAADDLPGGDADGPVAVISYALWQRRFGGAASVIGAPLVVDGVPITIVGVTPPEFFGVEVGRPFDVVLPLRTKRLFQGDSARLHAYSLAVMLRLKPGQSPEAGTTLLRSVQPHVLGVRPDQMATVTPANIKEPFLLVSAAAGTSGAQRFASGLRQSYQRPLLTIFVVVLVVLLIACVNIANLLLARAAARRHELSVRLALGAPRARLVRQLLIESLVLACLGAVLGLLFATWGSQALVAQLATSVDRITLNLSLDWRVVTFTAAIAMATVAIFGTAPALRATRIVPMDALKAQGRAAAQAASGARGSTRLSSGLVVVQIALSLVLVVAAGLFLRTFERLASVPLGFDRDGVLVVNVDTRRAGSTQASQRPLSERILDAVRGTPGVAHAGGSIWTPIDGGLRFADPQRHLTFNFVTPGWFAAYGTAVRIGRDFTERDAADAPRVVIVNHATVRALLPDRSPIGEAIPCPRPRGSGGANQCTIVGVVGDAVFDSQRDGTQAMAYLPLAQSVALLPGATDLSIGVRATAGSPMRLARSVGVALTAVDPGLSFTFRPLADQVDASLARERLVARLSGFFGALALLLAALGLYGVTSYAVSRRSTEIGIRMALGAQRVDVLGLVLGRSLALTGVGVVLGLAAAAAVTRYIRGMLFGLTPLDPATFIGVAVLFAAVATLAASIPARRATKVDPLVALRCD